MREASSHRQWSIIDGAVTHAASVKYPSPLPHCRRIREALMWRSNTRTRSHRATNADHHHPDVTFFACYVGTTMRKQVKTEPPSHLRGTDWIYNVVSLEPWEKLVMLT
ncbi:hypothetical protein F2Q69_00017591 [Brassica cretica]|uniref:Uncharacterized protein n=1 Tax=Brassica cretica TaxID=69181 RepID=A0A8S9QPQ2_BRACR|nr:hypothetical protein F2Q69_00017591 [Brassica cretica]